MNRGLFIQSHHYVSSQIPQALVSDLVERVPPRLLLVPRVPRLPRQRQRTFRRLRGIDHLLGPWRLGLRGRQKRGCDGFFVFLWEKPGRSVSLCCCTEKPVFWRCSLSFLGGIALYVSSKRTKMDTYGCDRHGFLGGRNPVGANRRCCY